MWIWIFGALAVIFDGSMRKKTKKGENKNGCYFNEAAA